MKYVLYLSCCLCFLQAQAQNDFAPHHLGRTTGKLPSLAYGLGTDRLGSAKMGYLDSNVLVRVIDSVDNLYQVQLSRFHTAYIEKTFVKPDSAGIEKSQYLTNSIIAKGDSAFDYVGISLEEKLPYHAYMEINPSRILLDIYGVKSNTNWVTQLRSLKEVKNVYYNQVEDDLLRITIELKHAQHWGFHVAYEGHKLMVRIKRQPPKPDIRTLKIAIDAGHGGTNSGTGGVHARYTEKYYTLLFAQALERNLKRKGVRHIIMTRTRDTTFDNKDRILFLQEQDPDILISLHLNSSDNKEINGVSTYYKYIGFRPLSLSLLNRMLELPLNEFGNVGSFNFALNSPTDFPNALVEIAFLSNPDDEKKILRQSFQEEVANKLYLGITDWLKGLK
ncbi:MAG: N-acetylmuramoyl-L-alanine amidase [Bacteroidota bacterium]|nr:N-acetylmuramoyl-L-alanine amidase [Bacteroidota bacterium]